MGLWILSLFTAMSVAHSRTTSAGIGQTSQTALPDSSNPLPLEFFDNLRCPPVLASHEAIDAEVSQGGAAGAGDSGGVGVLLLLRKRPPPLFLFILFYFIFELVLAMLENFASGTALAAHKLYL